MCLCICAYVCLCVKEGKFHLATTKVKPQQSKLTTSMIEVMNNMNYKTFLNAA